MSEPWSALGFGFGLHCPDERLDALTTQLAGLEVSPPSPPLHVFEVGFDPETDWAAQVSAFIGALTLRAIAASEGELLLHAGAVSDPAGGVAVVCGRSGSGKSTLTARLTEGGLAYLTDETVRLDPATLRVTPFRRPALLKSGSHPVLPHLCPPGATPGEGTWVIAPATLGCAPVPDAPLLPRLLIFPRYDRKASACEVGPMTAAQAAFELGDQSSRLKLVRGGPLPALARLVRRAPAYRLHYSDGAAAAAVVRGLLASA